MKDFYKKQDIFHNESHAKKVSAFAKKIARENDKIDFLLLEAGAWLHQMHDNLSELKKLLKKINLSKKTEDKLYFIVKNCRPNKIKNEKSLEGRIIYDADALAVLSNSGLFRELFCNYFVRDLGWEESKKRAKKVKQLFKNTLQTDIGKKMASDFEKVTNFFKKIILWRIF
jgi:HD superfamily phosphodiesterase